jgi:hypothetical protein
MHLPLLKICSIFRLVRGSLELEALGVCKIQKCMYNDEMGCMIEECKLEHQREYRHWHIIQSVRST